MRIPGLTFEPIRVVAVPVLVALAVAFGVASAAQQTTPPSQELRNVPGANLVTVQASGPADGRNYRFAVRQRHFGDGEHESLELALDDVTMQHVNPGVEYLLGYTELTRSRLTDKTELARVVPRLVRVVAAGEMIAAKSPALLRLLDGTLDRVNQDKPRELAQALLELMDSSDPRTARIASGEMLGRFGVEHQLNPQELAWLSSYIADTDRDTAARLSILDFALSRNDEFESAWWASGVADVLARTPVEIPNGPYWPSLISSALRVASLEISPADERLLDRWLHASHPGVVEAAMGAIARTNPQRLESAMAAAASVAFIDAGSRLLLEQGLDRLKRAKRASGDGAVVVEQAVQQKVIRPRQSRASGNP